MTPMGPYEICGQPESFMGAAMHKTGIIPSSNQPFIHSSNQPINQSTNNQSTNKQFSYL